MLKPISFAAVLVFAAAPVAAEDSSTAKGGNSYDPNRIVCEKIEVTGSRVKARKVCATALQWEIKRQSDRDDLERAQKNIPAPKDN